MKKLTFLVVTGLILHTCSLGQETLQTVTDRGSTTTNSITVGAISSLGTNSTTVDVSLSSSSYQSGNFQAYVTLTGYQSGARPGYGFHAGNTLGMYLYANTENQLRIRNGSNADFEIWHSGNSNPFNKAEKLYALNQDFNTYTLPGLYEFDGVMPNAPNGSPNFRVLSMGNDQRWTQMAFQWDANRSFFRRKIDNSFTNWSEFWHSGNFTPSNYLALTGGSITGNIGIGTESNSNYKLTVNGAAVFKKVVVKNATPWPDYVFDSAYRLPPLEQVETYIKKNKHLADIPSAASVQSEGLDLGEIQKQLVKKMEEFTLYLIELKKENQLLKDKIKSMDAELSALRQ